MAHTQQDSADAHNEITRLALRFGQIAYDETRAFQPRILLLQFVTTLVPPYVGGRLRSFLMRLAGLRIGKHTTIMGLPRMYGKGSIHRRLSVGDYVVMNIGCHLDLNDSIMIAARVSLGQEVIILTTSHRIGDSKQRAGKGTTMPVTINTGAWIGARALILPGVTIGAGSIVGAGAVVTKDIPPNMLAAGVPARILRAL